MVKYIYFIQQGDSGPIKIGISVNPINRHKYLQSSTPNELILLGVIEGDRDLEESLHARFENYRLVGEWFTPEADLITFIEHSTIKLSDKARRIKRQTKQRKITVQPIKFKPTDQPPKEMDYLRQYFNEHGISTYEVATRTGYSVHYIRNILNGSDAMNDRARFRLAVKIPDLYPILMPNDNGNGPKEESV